MESPQIYHKSGLLPTLAAEEEIDVIRHCKGLNKGCEAAYATDTRVVQYKDYAVKFGKVSVEEAENQLYACENLDPTIVKVPQIHGYFTVAGIDYLIMQFIAATNSTINFDEDSVNDIARIVVHLHSIQRDRPGPLQGGNDCRSMLWRDDVITIASRKDLETTISRRLNGEDFRIGESPFVLNHGDIRPENFIKSNSEWYLCDWEYASFLPRTAEIASLRHGFATTKEEHTIKLRIADDVHRIKPLDREESSQVDGFLTYAYNIVAYAKYVHKSRPEEELANPRQILWNRPHTKAKT
ncbi:hypothetical protein KC367_g8928 [Hortaea werneckii]|nr:hypothetical protein KC357_g8938 [Hortaea werneckii]KAI7492931.1 hypothetical protein KC367_g8928 [Hortaea werneckii]